MPAPGAARPKKILLVDDSATILMMERMLLGERYTLLTASDGQEAVEKAVAERPDAILMDVAMPRMSGFEALRELRRREDTRAIPVIMVTTRGEAENVQAAFEIGCSDYITKPIDAVQLLAKLRHLLGE